MASWFRYFRRVRSDLKTGGQTLLRAQITERIAPGVVYTTFHFPESGANVITTDNSDWATNCPEYKVTAVEVGRTCTRWCRQR